MPENNNLNLTQAALVSISPAALLAFGFYVGKYHATPQWIGDDIEIETDEGEDAEDDFPSSLPRENEH